MADEDVNNASDNLPIDSPAYALILDHIFSNPTTYQMPLRTMYAINCASRPPVLRNQTPNSSPDLSPVSPRVAFEEANQTFADNLMAQMANKPHQPVALPVSYLTSFLRRAFPPELLEVDFSSGMTAVDYLRDLEQRRRHEVNECMQRLGIDRSDMEQNLSHPRHSASIRTWANRVYKKSLKIDGVYSHVYMALRRWIMINELSLLPFNKHSSVALLNTLYPPSLKTLPSTHLTNALLKHHHDGMFKFITSVERSGAVVLRPLMEQGMELDDTNGWPAVTRSLGNYLQLTINMIKELESVTCPDDIEATLKDPHTHRSKVDSGVSLPAPEKRPSSANSAASDPQPEIIPAEIPRPKTPYRANSALEKFARSFKSFGISRVEAVEILPEDEPIPQVKPVTNRSKTLRKIRSMGNIGDRSKSHSVSPQDPSAPGFDVEEVRRRQRLDAGHNNTQAATIISHEV